MNFGLSVDEVNELIQVLDEDGNGVLCEKEFEDMVLHHYPPEFEHHEENWVH